MVDNDQETRLHEILSGYSSVALNTLARDWGVKVRTANRMNKFERCVHLAHCLCDSGQVEAKIASLDEPCRMLLAVGEQIQEDLTVGRIVFAAESHGIRNAVESLHRLMKTGLLLVKRNTQENRLELDQLADLANRCLVLPDQLKGKVKPISPPRESLPTVDEQRIRTITEGEPVRLVSGLVYFTARGGVVANTVTTTTRKATSQVRVRRTNKLRSGSSFAAV